MEKPDPRMVSDLKKWVKSHPAGLDPQSGSFLLTMLDMVEILLRDKTTQKKAVETLRQLMGILPRSERGRLDKFDLKGDENEPEQDPKKLALERQIRNLINKHRRIYGNRPERHRKARKSRKVRQNSRHGGEEALYGRAERSSANGEDSMSVHRPTHFDDLKGLRSSSESHKRYNLEIQITEMTYHVETVVDPRTGQAVRASMQQVGPEGWQLTWNAVINIVHLVVVFAMPAHRAASFLANDKGAFGESTLLRVIQYCASLLVPIYTETFKQMAQSRRLNGDDSTTRVLGVERAVRKADDGKINEDDTEKKMSSFEKQIGEIDSLLGFQFQRKDGKPKRRLNVTMVTGRIVAEDQWSQISLVRTHLGAFGNLLDRLILRRGPERKEITVQSDQSTTNLASEQSSFNITYAACMAHARRPFWRHRDVDPLNCYQVLRGFALLSVVEDFIDIHDRTEEVSDHWRGRYGRKIWSIIKRQCEQMMTEHMPNSELYRAASYVVNHYPELTYYLNDSWVHTTNNQIERILRSERIMLNNSKFRQSKKGRVAYDIIRTIQFCCTGAGVCFLDYLRWVLPNSREAAQTPSVWTPYAFRQRTVQTAQPPK